EEVEALLIAVEDGDAHRHGPAERGGDIVVAVPRFGGAAAVIEEVLRVELFVAFVIGGGAVELGAAMLGEHVDLGAALEAVFRGVGVGLDVAFGNGVDAGDAAEVASAPAIAAVHTVRVDGVAAAALEGRHGRLETAAPGVLVRDHGDAGEGLE